MIHDEPIDFVDSARDLGFQINRTNTVIDHVEITQRKVLGAISSLKPLRYILPTKITLQLYKSLILPIIDYIDIIYHNYGTYGTIGKGEKIEKL